MKAATKWLKIGVSCPEHITEAVSDLVGVLSGVGVEVRPLKSRHRNMVTGFFMLAGCAGGEVTAAAADIRDRVSAELEKLHAIYNLILSEPEVEIIDDEEWATSWQRFFTPFEIVPGLVIKPSWEQYNADPGQHVITMDPGMAFGTGQHASTRLALSLIASCFGNGDGQGPKKILDVGTGTGILAMAGAVFGADQVMAIDNDPEAVEVARHNIHANYLDWNIGVSVRPLALLDSTYDLICANIVHDVLVEMAPDLRRLLENGGQVILAGILRGEQEENIARVFSANGLDLLRSEHEAEWAAMLLGCS